MINDFFIQKNDKQDLNNEISLCQRFKIYPFSFFEIYNQKPSKLNKIKYPSDQ